MNKFLPLIVIVLIASCAVLPLGCGGGSDSNENQASLDKFAFIKRAEAICKRGEGEQLNLILAYKKKHPKAEEEELIEPAAIPPLENEVKSIRAMGVPEGERGSINAWLEEFEVTLRKVKKDPASLVDLRNNPFERANELAAKYGLKTCGGAP